MINKLTFFVWLVVEFGGLDASPFNVPDESRIDSPIGGSDGPNPKKSYRLNINIPWPHLEEVKPGYSPYVVKLAPDVDLYINPIQKYWDYVAKLKPVF